MNSKRVTVKANKELFEEFYETSSTISVKIKFLSAIVQNDMELTTSEIDEWIKDMNNVIDEIRKDLGILSQKVLVHIMTKEAQS